MPIRATGRYASSSRRDEREPPVALGIQVAPRREANLLGRDRSHAVDVGELLGEPPHCLGVAEQAGPPLGGLAPGNMLGPSPRGRPAGLPVRHPPPPPAPDPPPDFGLGAGAVR